MFFISEHAESVKTAIDKVVEDAGLKNCNALARRLDVSKLEWCCTRSPSVADGINNRRAGELERFMSRHPEGI